MVNVVAGWKVRMYVSQSSLGAGRLKVLFHDAPRDHEEDYYAAAQDASARRSQRGTTSARCESRT